MTRTSRTPILIAAGVIGVVVAAWLAFGFFGIQTAFIDNEVNEAGPEFAAASADTQDAITLAQGDFAGASRYEITGQAVVLSDGSDQRVLRFEDFESSNGPDLKVYLRADNGDFVSLGDLKGNIGSQNYEIPTDVDLSLFSTVEIWCERFSVGFGGAELA